MGKSIAMHNMQAISQREAYIATELDGVADYPKVISHGRLLEMVSAIATDVKRLAEALEQIRFRSSRRS
jgi:hypothetical protein